MRKTLFSLTVFIFVCVNFSNAQTRVPNDGASPIYYKNGNIGIGTNDPKARLHVNGGDILLDLPYSLATNPKIQMHCPDNNANIAQTFYRWSGVGERYFATRFFRDGGSGFSIQTGISSNEIGSIQFDNSFTIANNGNIGIGKAAPITKLDVAGNIKAQEIEVALASMQDLNLDGTLAANNITYTANGQTADHVFEENYNLRSLEEIEVFILENKHLLDVPSAEAMEEEGVHLAEMNKLLLKKVGRLNIV